MPECLLLSSASMETWKLSSLEGVSSKYQTVRLIGLCFSDMETIYMSIIRLIRLFLLMISSSRWHLRLRHTYFHSLSLWRKMTLRKFIFALNYRLEIKSVILTWLLILFWMSVLSIQVTIISLYSGMGFEVSLLGSRSSKCSKLMRWWKQEPLMLKTFVMIAPETLILT